MESMAMEATEKFAKDLENAIDAAQYMGVDKTKHIFYMNNEDARTVLEALKKQILKKPDISGDGYDKYGCLVYDTYTCPTCGKDYELDYDNYDYCPACGQRLDLSDWKN